MFSDSCDSHSCSCDDCQGIHWSLDPLPHSEERDILFKVFTEKLLEQSRKSMDEIFIKAFGPIDS